MMDGTLSSKPGRRQRIRNRIMRLWRGHEKTDTNHPDTKSWRNLKSYATDSSHRPRSTSLSCNSTLVTSASQDDLQSSRSPSIIHRPFCSVPNSEGVTRSYKSFNPNVKITEVTPANLTNKPSQTSFYSAGTVRSSCCSSNSSGSMNASETFSPTTDHDAQSTPITPIAADVKEIEPDIAEPVYQQKECVRAANGSINAIKDDQTALDDSQLAPTAFVPSEANINSIRTVPNGYVLGKEHLHMVEHEEGAGRGLNVSEKKVRFDESAGMQKKPEQTKGPTVKYRRCQPSPKLNETKIELFSRTWENFCDESWYVRFLNEYCPVRFRRNRQLNFDSYQFRSIQYQSTLKTLMEQEVRGKDRKLIFRPTHCRWLHFEEDKDVLDFMDQFILCNEGLTPIFRGTRPAVRKHFFRRWLNLDRDRTIICEQLLENWSEDKQFLDKLRRDREKRNQLRSEMERRQEKYNTVPSISFFMERLVSKLTGKGGRIGKSPKRGSQLVVLRKEPLFGIPYFEEKRSRAKRWVKNILLGAN